ncbi:hypothetical protein CsSME_00049893 [Camellia sinensis var. sinensis]
MEHLIDDPELDRMFKERVRWGDPMAHLVKKKYPEHVLSDLGDDDKMKESGFIVPQDIPSHSWLKRGLDAAPNRYGIRPGRHWDGVDRSNAYILRSVCLGARRFPKTDCISGSGSGGGGGGGMVVVIMWTDW